MVYDLRILFKLDVDKFLNSEDVTLETPVTGKSRIFTHAPDTKVLTQASRKKQEHECTHCSKTFQTCVKLKRQTVSHPGTKPFMCKLAELKVF